MSTPGNQRDDADQVRGVDAVGRVETRGVDYVLGLVRLGGHLKA